MTVAKTTPLLSNSQIHELCRFAAWADREARSDLAGGYIRDEDDYTSTFTGALRRIINSNTETGLRASSRLLDTDEERRTGCDAAIIIRGDHGSKAALFEAKWPRIASPSKRWDYPQTATGQSHYSDQLQRQSAYVRTFAIFEMFYCECSFGTQPAPFPYDQSACVWHEAARDFDGIRGRAPGPWDDAELISLLSGNVLVVQDVLRELCECRVGMVFPKTMGTDLLLGEFRAVVRHVLEIDATTELNRPG